MYLPKDGTRLSPARRRMVKDARFIAAHVVSDMGAAFLGRGALWTDYLGERFGDFQWKNLRPEYSGLFFPESETILLSVRLTEGEAASTLRHEIAHKLCVRTERYAELEQPHFREYDYRTFHEMIAETVGKAYERKSFYTELMKCLN